MGARRQTVQFLAPFESVLDQTATPLPGGAHHLNQSPVLTVQVAVLTGAVATGSLDPHGRDVPVSAQPSGHTAGSRPGVAANVWLARIRPRASITTAVWMSMWV